ncbi:hypothetical protein EDD86DRAFT_205075 [Gorgonomyces haynaldii]|nr:hypothetical protein EDD86DRAFT_205075 [Gorgonomyces haynaldii]
MSQVTRLFLQSVASFGQQQSTILFLDLVMTWSAYLQVMPNFTILLLAIGSSLKGMNIVWLYLAAAYTNQYSDTLCTLITVMLEVGWYFLDHIAGISTLHRCHVFYKDTAILQILYGLTAVSLVIGAGLRGLRSSCRLGACLYDPLSDQTRSAVFLDSAIAANLLVMEAILLGALLYKCIQFQQRSKEFEQNTEVFDVFIIECWLRLGILLPLGAMEITGYIFTGMPKDSVPLWINWLAQNGIFAREMAPAILVVAILAAKEKRRNMSTAKSSNPSSRSYDKSNVNTVYFFDSQ